jgi:hypothetical protein
MTRYAGEDGVRNADGPRVAHMSGRRVVLAFRNVRDHWRDERPAKLFRDLARRGLHDVVVLADDHVRTILLKSTAWDDHGGETVLDGGPHLDPSQLGNFHLWR